jgi:hypothetical protein
MKHLGHTYGGFVPAISEWGMTLNPTINTPVLLPVESEV